MTQNKEVFCTLIAEFDLRFDKEQPDYLEAVSALMIFLQRMMFIQPIPDSSYTRTQCLPGTFFRQLLDISANNESQLEKFLDLINAVANDVNEDSFQRMNFFFFFLFPRIHQVHMRMKIDRKPMTRQRI